jgi:hypothetical protein
VLSTPLTERRTSGSTSGWSIAATTGTFATPSSGMCMCAPPDCASAARPPSASVPIAKPACSTPRREACGPSPRLVPKNLCALAMIWLPLRELLPR